MSFPNKLRSAHSKVQRATEWPARTFVEKFNNSSTFRKGVGVVIGAQIATGGATAQIEEAAGMLCGTGGGVLLSLLFGALALLSLLAMAIKAWSATQNMGSPRKDKKQKGREQLKDAGFSGVGVIVPGVIGVVLDTLGIGVFSCIDWQGIVGMGGGATASIVVTGVTSLPF